MKHHRVSTTGLFFLLPAVVFLVYANYVPFVWNFVLSFQKWNGYLKQSWTGLGNYTRLFSDDLFAASVFNSTFLAVTATVGAVSLGLALAAFLYKVTKAEGAVYRLILFLPSMMPIAVIALLFTFIYNPEMGLLNNALRALGLGDLTTAWLEDKSTLLWCIAVVNLWRMAGLTMMLCYTAMVMLPASLFESSHLDGAGYLTQFTRIVLPLILPIIQLSAVFTLSTNFKTFDTVFVLTRGGPGNLSMTVPIYMTDTAFTFGEFGYAATMGVAITAVIMLTIAGTSRLLRGESHEF